MCRRNATPTISVRKCDFADTAGSRRKFRSRYVRWETHLEDLPTILYEAIRSRFAPPAKHDRPDLEFIPWACLMHPRTSRPPRLGSFTVFASAWADFALECFADTRYMCALSAANCTAARLRGVAILSIESPSYVPSWQTYPTGPSAKASLTVASLVRSQRASLPAGVSKQIPYPTSAHWDGIRMPEAPSLQYRTTLAALVANVYESNASSRGARTDGREVGPRIGRGPLRALLHTECQAAPVDKCISRGATRGSSGIWQTNNETLAAYKKARFCLQPWGDTSTRKGFWDAMLAGCINVIFDDAGWNETDTWFGDHREYTVRMPLMELRPGGQGALAFLEKISAERLQRLHNNVLAMRGRVHYAILGGTPGGDAIDVIAHRMQSHFAAVRSGPGTMSSASRSSGDACRSIIQRVCHQNTCHP